MSETVRYRTILYYRNWIIINKCEHYLSMLFCNGFDKFEKIIIMTKCTFKQNKYLSKGANIGKRKYLQNTII